MRPIPTIALPVLATLSLVVSTTPSSATTLIRRGLEALAAENESIVLGTVLETHSYWNQAQSFILTDVRLRPERIVKGDPVLDEITFTIPGGTVGDLTTLIVGGPELVPGSRYLLFLAREDLPGRRRALGVRDLMQGIFDVRGSGRGHRAVSQAASHGLLPDAAGISDPAGGTDGYDLEDLIGQLDRIVRH